MTRWIAFDQQTATALATALPGAELASGAGDELDAALDAAAADVPVAVVTPAAAAGGEAVLITIRARRSGQAEAEALEPVGYQAGGFLGLSDEPVFEDEEKQ